MAWDVLGHDWAVELLQQHLRAAAVRHAYLFTGPDGIGKRTLALRFAQALNCENPPGPGQYCGNCRPCRLIPDQAYPDLHVLAAPEVGGTLDVEQVRTLQRQLTLTPYEGRWRVALLLRFHEASASAANALLKTLEEPPPQVVLLLTARTPESLLATIVSRCELLRLRTLPIDRLEAALSAGVVPADQAWLLAGLSGGRPGWAIRWSKFPEDLARRQEALEDLLPLLAESNLERFAFADAFTRGNDPVDVKRRNVTEALEVWLSLWRDLALCAHGLSERIVHRDRAAEVQSLSDRMSPERITEGLAALQAALEAVGVNANLRLTLEALMLDLPHLRQS